MKYFDSTFAELAKYEVEWLDNSKHSLKLNTYRYVVPLYLLYWLVDTFMYPEVANKMLLVRCVSIPITLFFLNFTVKSQTVVQFLNRYMFAIMLYAGIMHILIILSQDMYAAYYAGLLMVFIGATVFVPLPRIYYFLSAILVYSPFYITIFFFKLYPYDLNLVIMHTANLICYLLMLDFARVTALKNQLSNYQYRNFLGSMLQTKENELTNLTQNINYLKRNYIERLNDLNYFRIARQLSHDIRSPLSVINTCIQSLQVNGSNCEAQNMIQLASQRINGIAEKMLSDAKQKYKTEQEVSCKLSDVLLNQIREFNIKHGADNLQISCITPSADITIPISKNDFSTVLSIVFDNAFESKQGDLCIIQIVSQTHQQEPSGSRYIVLEITDRGRGIPPELINKVGSYGFTYGKKNGNGIGLAYVKNILHFIGGEIQIESKVNEYTKIKIVIPILGA